MKRFLTNLILIISILSILVIPSFAATTSDSDDIVILKQPVDAIVKWNSNGYYQAYFTVVALGDDLTYLWQYSYDGTTWKNFSGSSSIKPKLNLMIYPGESDTFVRCKISSGSTYIYSRVALGEIAPTNIFNFVGSCLRYITSYISLIINSLVTPGAPLYNLLPVLCIGIGVAALLIVIKITKGFSWGM